MAYKLVGRWICETGEELDFTLHESDSFFEINQRFNEAVEQRVYHVYAVYNTQVSCVLWKAV